MLCSHGVDGRVGAAGEHADRLRVRGLFAAVHACCLTGAPGLGDIIAEVPQRHVFVVPFLMSEGYTARVVLPRQIADLDTAERRIALCRPVGTSALLLDVVESRIRESCRRVGWALGDPVLAIAGHGTPRHPNSGATARELASRLRRRGLFKAVETGFLAQEPNFASVIDRHRRDRVVAVGLFADDGPHGRADMERLLAAAGPNAVYGGPVGPAPEMAAAILERVRHSASALVRETKSTGRGAA